MPYNPLPQYSENPWNKMAELGDMLTYEYRVVTSKIVWNAYQKIYLPCLPVENCKYVRICKEGRSSSGWYR
ncbi:HepT-like ribonuclease domain-containing protein [Desulfolucanica intricata]|uniref:HepT-like ribonuclease domain-containing protein n=1 Tax=Desulfolucanica intricata TaxID=1285191 RepID=UPI00350E4816